MEINYVLTKSGSSTLILNGKEHKLGARGIYKVNKDEVTRINQFPNELNDMIKFYCDNKINPNTLIDIMEYYIYWLRDSFEYFLVELSKSLNIEIPKFIYKYYKRLKQYTKKFAFDYLYDNFDFKDLDSNLKVYFIEYVRDNKSNEILENLIKDNFNKLNKSERDLLIKLITPVLPSYGISRKKYSLADLCFSNMQKIVGNEFELITKLIEFGYSNEMLYNTYYLIHLLCTKTVSTDGTFKELIIADLKNTKRKSEIEMKLKSMIVSASKDSIIEDIINDDNCKNKKLINHIIETYL